ncbi:transcriptional regulator, TetR family [Paracoccus halophilus]|uniref:Transcriptional regulator, TetR family n=1 Tax=Paracoccus halophilus TaxID=376733 RepID=A0A099F3T2_9RHOB|nr:CerR family C-terminal domain-containing protein [Paracoccus halophilus]KGJ05375.1 hypothetical protein IT41_06290 [Paracoccus halophilus]SFA48932.1 transcriptional regulator, TetR family [Paracoccus halophilus]
MSDDSTPRDTRAALIAAGLHQFGRDGFAASSTRALAARAGTNVASIAYHFGGKEALRLACAEEVLDRIAAVAGPPQEPAPMPAGQATARLAAMMRALAMFLTRAPGAADIVSFVLREMAEEGPALDLLYDRFFVHKHRELCALTAMATGRDPEDEDTRLLVFSILGQAIYFRLGQPLICRRMGWTGYDEAQARAIADRMVANLHAILQAAA